MIFGLRCGGLGQALGCMLAGAGHDVDLVLRGRFIEALRKDGLRVSGIFGDFAARPAMLGLLENISEANGLYNFILITTKAYDTDPAVAAIASLSGCRCPVVSMQNGCGNVEKVLEQFGPERSLAARVITGFEIIAPGHVRITVSAVADIHQDLHAKLLYNCALNPLGAILGVHYGALAENEETRAIMDQVIDETFAVIQRIGGKVSWPDADSYKQVFYDRLVPITADHRPSMLQDLENGKPTEVEALLGYVSKQGSAAAVPTPACDLLAGLVRFQETRLSF